MNLWKNGFKRAFDFCAALCALVVLSPLLAGIAVWLRFANGRAGVFFSQERPGKDGKIFRLYKFKSMTDARGSDGNLLSDAERITAAGRFVRKTSIDELPQLFNVLRGDMALVGPRPLLVRYLPFYRLRERLRHTVRPGMTGWAQVNGRNCVSWDKKLSLDADYVEKLSFLFDMKIIFLTIGKVLSHSGVETVSHEEFLDVERAAENFSESNYSVPDADARG